MLVALSLGRYQLSLSDLIATLTGQASVSPVIHNIVFSLRLPRILAAAAIGAALAISGTAYQSIFQNPLVSPDLLGVSNGAAVGAALAILLGWHTDFSVRSRTNRRLIKCRDSPSDPSIEHTSLSLSWYRHQWVDAGNSRPTEILS